MSSAVSYDSYPFVVHDFFADSLHVLRWPNRKSLSEWSIENAYISADGNAEPGRFRPYPFQIGIMDAMTDPKTERVSIMKSARVGYTTMIGNLIGYHIDHDPCPVMMVQPTIDMAEDYSKNDFECMVRDVDSLAKLINTVAKNRGRSTLSFKVFPGGTLRIIGANSPTGFRKVSIRILIFDEIDGYPPEAGTEGDPISLGIKRTETFWNRHIICGSTPTSDKGIALLYEDGDQRRYHVPCPSCGLMHPFEFSNMKWPDNRPGEAYFECPGCKDKIVHDKKIWMVDRGEWIAGKPFKGHASFHIWAAYSYAPNATWGHIAEAFVAAQKKGARFLKTFINTWLGEVWKEATESPDWNNLYSRRESYPARLVPAAARYVTIGADVQKDRIEAEVVAWGPGLESWTLDYHIFEGDTADIDKSPAWTALHELLNEQFESETGVSHPVTKLGVDASFYTQQVVNWCRKYGGPRAIAIKGDHRQAQIIRPPRSMDVRSSGKRKKHGARLWLVGVSHIKRELYSWYRLPVPTESDPIPRTGFCHFGEFLDEHYFRMLTSEELLRVHKKNGMTSEEWHLPSGRRNEALDCRVYNRAMAYLCGVDTMLRDDVPTVSIANKSRRPLRSRSEAHTERERRERPARRARSSYW
jgi:Bacteriophage tail assembly protein